MNYNIVQILNRKNSIHQLSTLVSSFRSSFQYNCSILLAIMQSTLSQQLPQYFPLKLKKCAAPAEAFFACFETEAAPNGDRDVARKAIAKCGEQLNAYKACMDNFVGPKAASRSVPVTGWSRWVSWSAWTGQA
ncbi:hypothetical protein RTP6_007251 [Batrachochytrium dendrobatidis]